MRQKRTFSWVWLWVLVPVLPVAFCTMQAGKSPKVGEVRHGLVYGADGDWHTPEPAWVQAVKEARRGDRLTVAREGDGVRQHNGRVLKFTFCPGDEVIVVDNRGEKLQVKAEGGAEAWWVPTSLFWEP